MGKKIYLNEKQFREVTKLMLNEVKDDDVNSDDEAWYTDLGDDDDDIILPNELGEFDFGNGDASLDVDFSDTDIKTPTFTRQASRYSKLIACLQNPELIKDRTISYDIRKQAKIILTLQHMPRYQNMPIEDIIKDFNRKNGGNIELQHDDEMARLDAEQLRPEDVYESMSDSELRDVIKESITRTIRNMKR